MSSSIETVGVKVDGDTAGVVQALSELAATSQQAVTHLSTLTASLSDIAQASQGSLATSMQAAAAFSEQAKTAQDAGEKHQSLAEKVEKAGGAFKDLGDSAIKMGTAIRQGTNPLMAITEQMPAIVGTLSSFTPAGMAVGAALTAVGTAGYMLISHLVEVDEKIQGISGHMAGVGRGAEGLPPAIEAWSDEVLKEIGGTKEHALMLIGAITGAMPRAATQVQKDTAKVAGAFADMLKITDDKQAEKLTEAIGAAASGDFAAIHALNQQYNLLNATELDSLETAEKYGNSQKAAATIMDGLTHRVGPYIEALKRKEEAERKDGGWSDLRGFKGAPNEYYTNHQAAGATRADVEKARQNPTQPDEAGLRAREQGRAKIAELSDELAEELARKGAADREYLESEVKKWQDLIATQKLQGNNLMAAQQKLAEAQGQLDRQKAADAGVASREAQAQALAATAAGAQQHREALDAQTRQNREALNAQLSVIKDGVSATREGTKEREDALANELVFLKARYGEESAEATRVAREIAAAHKATLDAEIKNLQESLAANFDHDEQLKAGMASLRALQVQRYGEDTKDLKDALQQDADLLVQAALTKAQKRDADQKAERKEDLADADFRRQMMNLSVTEMVTAKINQLETERDITLRIMDEERYRAEAAAATYDQKLAVQARFIDQEKKLVISTETQMTQISRQAARDRQKEYQQVVSSVTKSMGSMVQGLITGSKTVRQSLSEMANQVLSQLVGMAERQATAWVMSNLLKQTSDEDTATKAKAQSADVATTQIQNASATGGANAYASASAGPEWWIAPAISLAVQTAISGLSSGLSSAAGGWGQVPADGMLTELHKDEMVLPAGIASPLRSMLAAQKLPTLAVATTAANLNLPGGGGNASNSVASGGGGGVTFNVQAMDSRDVASFFNRHGDKLVATLRGQKRNFSL